MQLAVFQPDIPQNVGTLIRFSACMGVKLHIIEPCGFPIDEKKMRRAAMDYADKAEVIRHVGWEEFRVQNSEFRIILATTKAAKPYTKINYKKNDILLMGRESAGVPEEVHAAADERVLIEMQEGCRSLNIAVSAAMIAGEMIRQTS